MGYEVFILLIGLGIGLFQMIREIRFLLRSRRCTAPVPAEVYNLYEKRRGRHGSRFTVIVRYEYNGSRYTAESAHSYHYNDFGMGQTLEIAVDPDLPDNMILSEERRCAWRGIAGAAAVIVLFIFLSVYTGDTLERQQIRVR